jgi:Tfp pilus assembly protein PilE
MGQQQLLLIVLGVIIVGIAVFVGISLFSSSSMSANRDAVASDLNNLSALARQYYNKPSSMGGGSYSFNGWDITTTGLNSTVNGAYTATVADQMITIVGTGVQTGNNGSTNVQETDYVTPAKDSIVVVN